MSALYNREYAKRHSRLFNSKLNDPFHNKVMKHLRPSKKEVILEVGCNQGTLVKRIRPLCKKIVGIDINKQAIKASKCPGLFHMKATDLKFEDEYFDKIVSLHTIEHIPDLKKALKEMKRVLKPGGLAVLSYPFELIRGMSCIGSAITVHKNVFMARKMHVHKLDKKKMEEFTQGLSLDIQRHDVILSPWPMFITTLIKLP